MHLIYAFIICSFISSVFAFDSALTPHISVDINCSQVLRNTRYDSCYSYSKKTPIAVLYIATKQASTNHVKRKCYFKVDYRIPIQYRSYPRDYSKTGYDRGHLAPYNLVDGTIKSAKESCLMSNIAPESRLINRSIWRRVEIFTGLFAFIDGKVEVLTGVCDTKDKVRNNVYVPKYIYTVILSRKNIFSFLVENSSKNGKMKLKDARTTLQDIENICHVKINISR